MVKASSSEPLAPLSASSTEAPPSQAATVLTNGRLTSRLDEQGRGGVMFSNLAITRSVPGMALGQWLYVRDLDANECWSATAEPAGSVDARYTAHLDLGLAEFRAIRGELEVWTDVCVAPDDDVEVRRLTITNHGSATRRLELTTYAELVLNTPAADRAHPAFAKLFVQTSYDIEHRALVATRRLRSPDDAPLTVAQVLFGSTEDDHEAIETDRMRFIGRGRTLAAPRALDADAELSGTVGAVLDPIFARRVTITLLAGATRQFVLALGAANDEHVLMSVSAYAAPERVKQVFDAFSIYRVPASSADRATVVPVPPGLPRRPSIPVAIQGEGLVDFNGYGGFTSDGDEYVVRIGRDAHGLVLPPLPWTNVIANERAGFIVSETGAGYAWSQNSRENRLTPWFNDPVSDPHGESLVLRDEDSGDTWSVTPGPLPGDGVYEVRHGFGYTRFTNATGDLAHDVWMFVPRHDPVKITRVRIANHGTAPRRLSLVSSIQLVLGVDPHETAASITTAVDSETGALFAYNRDRGEFSSLTAFVALGAPGTTTVASTADDNATLASARASFTLAPNEAIECVMLLGESENDDDARRLVRSYRDVHAAARALTDVQEFWRTLVAGVQVQTPSPALNTMVNGWLTYQNLSCRMWGRSAFYQSGGAFGFRDQLQDSAALVYLDPSITRQQILLHAAHQFVEGDVLHWWHPPTSKGIRTRFSDDLLWLPFITTFYVATTGDTAIFDEQVGFKRAELLGVGEDERFLMPSDADERATLYEHCCRAIDRSLTRGKHGLPRMGVGDWNDGMNRVGREGKGESVWLGFFLHDILRGFIPVVATRGDSERVERYSAYQANLRRALNADDGGWDGDWYRRAFYDNGAPLGSSASDECKIDAIAQAWSVLSGAAPPKRAERALNALEEQLVSERDGIIRLLTPAFDHTPNDPGYIKGYLPGVRENGGQYTHGAVWAVRALAEAGRTDRAVKLLEMLTPITHGDTHEKILTYKAEPYVVAADVYGVAPHVGRAGWTWYTGSAGWMYRVALESILGFELAGGTSVRLRPCIPAEWPGFTITYRIPRSATTYEFRVTRAGAGDATRVSPSTGACIERSAVCITLQDDGRSHAIDIALGQDVGRRYEEAPWPS